MSEANEVVRMGRPIVTLSCAIDSGTECIIGMSIESSGSTTAVSSDSAEVEVMPSLIHSLSCVPAILAWPVDDGMPMRCISGNRSSAMG